MCVLDSSALIDLEGILGSARVLEHNARAALIGARAQQELGLNPRESLIRNVSKNFGFSSTRESLIRNVFKNTAFSQPSMNYNLEKVPKHVGIILDGNRRFAKKLMLKPWMGHEWGAKKFWKFLEWCKEVRVKEVTAYTFSIQNFGRPKKEFDYLMGLFKKEFKNLQKNGFEKLKKEGIRINFIGRTWMFPKEVQEMMNKIMKATKNNKKYVVNFAMAYGGREEVIDAVKKLGEDIKKGKFDVKKLNEKTFGKYLYMNSDPELIIRTGGEKRTSNFLLWQGIYSEWFFVEKHWPDFEKQDFLKVLHEYEKRDRRFGK